MNERAWLAGAVAVAVLVVGGGAAAKDEGTAKAPAVAQGAKGQVRMNPAHRKQVERGAYLVRVAGCADCHTPLRFDEAKGMPVPMMERWLAGHPEGAPAPAGLLAGHDSGVIGPTFTSFRLPFGVVYAPNLTPDVETGLGGWREQDFVGAMRTGLHMGKGRALLPPMPWTNLAGATDEDLKAIFAYLQSLPPVKNRVPDNEVAPAVYERQEKANGMIRQTIGTRRR